MGNAGRWLEEYVQGTVDSNDGSDYSYAGTCRLFTRMRVVSRSNIQIFRLYCYYESMGLSKTDSFLCGMPMMTEDFRTRSILAPTFKIIDPTSKTPIRYYTSCPSRRIETNE